MERNNLQPSPNNSPSFVPNFAPNAEQQQAANPQAGPVPPLGNAPDLYAHPPVRNLQDYSAVAGETDTFNLPEYQPVKPGEPYMGKQQDESLNTKIVETHLKHAQEHENLGLFQDAEKTYKKALKYTDSAEHYKLYGECLRAIYLNLSQIPLSPEKDEALERVYKEKAAKAFYYLGDLYEKDGSFLAAQTAYRASSELAWHEVPLQALVAVARQVGETGDIVDTLEKLADFYVAKGKIDLAIEKLEETLQVEKSIKILQKLEVLCGQAGGEDSQLKVNESRIQQFELQISEDPNNISIYRDYAWFLKSIARHNEARAVKKRMDAVLQGLQQNLQTLEQKALKQKTKIGEQKGRIQFLEQKMELLYKKVFSLDFSQQPDVQDADLIPLLKKNPSLQFLNLESCTYLTDAVLDILPEYFENLEELNLRRCTGLTDAGIDAIAENASKLKRLTLDHCPATTIKLLHKLNAKGIAFTIEGLSFKKNKLDLSARKDDLTDAELLEALEANPEITELKLYECKKITDAGLAPLKNFQWLTSLNLYHCNQLTNAGLQHLKSLTQLTSLSLSSCYQLTGEGFQHLKGLTRLKWLDLSYCNQLTDAGLQHLKGLTQLTYLSLSYRDQLTDAGLQHLKGLTQLTSLDLGSCSQLTGEGLQHLKGLTQLTSLSLNSCNQLTDAGLQHLAGLTKLISLTLVGCNTITSGAKEELKKQIPGLTIHE